MSVVNYVTEDEARRSTQLKLERQRVYICGIFALLAGCSVGPDYEMPTVDLPQKWENLATQEPANSENKAWWKNFNDPLLNKLIHEAVLGNLDLQIAQTDILEARANLLGMEGNFFPSFSLAGSTTRSQRSLNDLQTSVSGKRISNLYSLGFDASWEVDFFGRASREYESAVAALQATIEGARSTLITLLAEIAQNYITLRSTQLQLQAIKENAQSLREIVMLTQELQKAGFASLIDVTQAETAATEAEAQVPSLEAAIKVVSHNLAVLLGKEPTVLYPELKEVQAIPIFQAEILMDLPSALLQNRPDIRQAERTLAASTANVGAAIAALFPQFSLTGNIGYQSAKNSNLLSGKSANWSFGPSFTLPIFNFGRISSAIEAQFALKDQAFLAYKKTILTALQDVENALVNYNNGQDRCNILKTSLAESQLNYSLSQDLYQTGLESFISLLRAVEALQSIKLQVIQSQANLALNIVALYKALGGGWRHLD